MRLRHAAWRRVAPRSAACPTLPASCSSLCFPYHPPPPTEGWFVTTDCVCEHHSRRVNATCLGLLPTMTAIMKLVMKLIIKPITDARARTLHAVAGTKPWRPMPHCACASPPMFQVHTECRRTCVTLLCAGVAVWLCMLERFSGRLSKPAAHLHATSMHKLWAAAAASGALLSTNVVLHEHSQPCARNTGQRHCCFCCRARCSPLWRHYRPTRRLSRG